jgi:hypothetical protein
MRGGSGGVFGYEFWNVYAAESGEEVGILGEMEGLKI